MKPTFEKSVAILEKAFFRNLLEPISCAACACGNLIAGYNDCEVVRTSEPRNDYEPAVFDWLRGGQAAPYSVVHAWYALVHRDEVPEGGAEFLRQAGYSRAELTRIEDAFMDVCGNELRKGRPREDVYFDALMAVVDVLADLHGVELRVSEAAKADFLLV